MRHGHGDRAGACSCGAWRVGGTISSGGGVMDAGIKVGVVTDLGRQRTACNPARRKDARGSARRGLVICKKSTVSLDFRLLTPYFITVWSDNLHVVFHNSHHSQSRIKRTMAQKQLVEGEVFYPGTDIVATLLKDWEKLAAGVPQKIWKDFGLMKQMN